jgi:hypothetical protein
MLGHKRAGFEWQIASCFLKFKAMSTLLARCQLLLRRFSSGAACKLQTLAGCCATLLDLAQSLGLVCEASPSRSPSASLCCAFVRAAPAHAHVWGADNRKRFTASHLVWLAAADQVLGFSRFELCAEYCCQLSISPSKARSRLTAESMGMGCCLPRCVMPTVPRRLS